ncbi:MAG: hypothetical protein ACTSR2_07425 [Candidatus Hodarchaeales archaeon]
MNLILKKEIEVTAGNKNISIKPAIDALDKDQIKVEQFVTKTFPLYEIDKAFQYYHENKDIIRVVLTNYD